MALGEKRRATLEELLLAGPAGETAAMIGRRLRARKVIEHYSRAHQIIDTLGKRGLAERVGKARNGAAKWAITESGRSALGPSLGALLAEFHVRVLQPQTTRGPRDTHAERTLEKLWHQHGEGHVRDILTCVLESENNTMALTHPVIVATSRLLLEHGEWWQRDASAWLAVYDRTNLMELARAVKPNQGAVSVPDALTDRLYARLAEVFKPEEERLL